VADDRRVLIAGGGLGGLTAALALRQVGFDPLVLEAAPRLLPYGSVLQLWPHGVQGLRAVGVGEAVVAKAGALEQIEFWNAKGRRLLRFATGNRESIAVSRGHLHETLASAVGEAAIRAGSAVVGFEQDDEGISAMLADGSKARGIVLIAADGVDSKLRELIAGPVEERFIGKGWGGVSEVDDPPLELGVSAQILGRGARVGIIYTTPNVVAWNSVVLAREDEDIGGKREALERFRGWPEPVEAAIAGSAEEAFFSRSIKDFLPISKWGEGRVTLLGDAAHATTPAQGRGVSEAVEDAIVLANRLAEVRDSPDTASVSAALRRYEDHRRPTTTRVTEGSMRVMKMGVLTNPAKIAGRNLFFRVAGPMLAKKMLEDAQRTIEPLAANGRPRPTGIATAD
jgi:2-polyprenyl-6-methoxyphenol hydroxylase-like FAD-dependent oxidoreductase